MSFRRLSDLSLVDGSDTQMNVCVVSSEFIGPVKNGGIATATSSLVRQLAADGHKVTLLYTFVEYGKPVSGDRPWQHWVDSLANDGIVLKCISHDYDYFSWRAKSWRVREFIGQGNFDLVYFNEHQGSGYYSLAAKRAGLEPFSKQLHCVITHGAMAWVFDVDEQYAIEPADLEVTGLERRSVEWADVVIGPSSYLLHQYENYGWQLPAQTFQQFYPLFDKPGVAPNPERTAIDELVFFGRLEVRKGLWLFCEALDRLAGRLAGRTVTFLGRMTDIAGLSSGLQVANRTSKWPCRVKMLTDFNGAEARAYLRKPGRLAVMPSLADNSPCVIYECMQDGIPFVSTLGSGADELVDPDSWSEALVSPNAVALTERLADILDRGARPALPRYNPQDNVATWSAWHRHLAKNRAAFITAKPVSPRTRTGGTADSKSGDPRRPLMVIIDRGSCSLSLLVENIASHLKRFSERVACLLVSSREGELQSALFDLFGGESLASPIAITTPHALDDARELMLTASAIFFLDAEIEISTPFFMLAQSLLTQRRTKAVSCVVAAKSNDSDELKIEELPGGDIPGLGALGEPIGSAVWAVSTEDLADDLAKLPFYDKQMDRLVSSASLGQTLLYRYHLANKAFLFLPMIGATVKHERGRELALTDQYNQTKRAAAALGITPSVYTGGAPWFAMSKFVSASRRTPSAQAMNGLDLPLDHPLMTIQKKGGATDLAELAAALGRPELSLQIEASTANSADRVGHLTNLSTQSIRRRPSIDLAKVLRAGRVMEFGGTALPKPGIDDEQRPSAGKAASVRPAVASELAGSSLTDADRTAMGKSQAYVDARRLRLRRNRVQFVADLSKTPGRMIFFDVPLCGNSHVLAKLNCLGSETVDVRMKAFDQSNGGLIGTALNRVGKKQASELSISLDEVFGWATVQLEFSGPTHAEVAIDSLYVV